MKQFHFNLRTLAFAAAALAGLSQLQAVTPDGPFPDPFASGRQLFSGTNGRDSHEQVPFGEQSELHPVLTARTGGPMKSAVDDPVPGYTPETSGYSNMKGPDGSNWRYTARYDYKTVRFNEYYSETLKTGFTFTIYDSKNRKVGEIHDKIRFAENEAWRGPDDANGNPTWYGRDVECVLDPAVSLHFFNTDDKPEVMVYHAMNTVNYINHYYYSVYSLGGEKDAEGYDVPILNIEGRRIETINTSDDPNNENFLYTFVIDPVVDWPLNDPNALEKLHASYFDVITYKPAVDDVNGPQVLIEKKIGNTHIPGDTTEGIYFMSKRHDGKLYFIYSQYEKPCFVDPRGGAIDESQTPDNSLVIDVYSTDGQNINEVSTTKIPLEMEESKDQLIYTFLSIGSVAWTDDVDMRVNGTADAPAFVVMRNVAAAATIDNMISSYYIYDNAGNKIKTIMENSEGFSLFRIPGNDEPLLMFLTGIEGQYWFQFVTLYTAQQFAKISQYNNGDSLYASCAPVKQDDGSYKFAFEMQYYEQDDYDNWYARVAWFDGDGSLSRIDRINLGKDVQASLVNMDPYTMKPTIYDTDDKMEYAVLVRRTYGQATRNEFLVVDDNGGRYATFSSDDRKGDPSRFTVYPGNPDILFIQYTAGSSAYALPFKNPSEPVEGMNAIENVSGDSEQAQPEYYNLQGLKVSNPSTPGIYIKKTGNTTTKIQITP